MAEDGRLLSVKNYVLETTRNYRGHFNQYDHDVVSDGVFQHFKERQIQIELNTFGDSAQTQLVSDFIDSKRSGPVKGSNSLFFGLLDIDVVFQAFFDEQEHDADYYYQQLEQIYYQIFTKTQAPLNLVC